MRAARILLAVLGTVALLIAGGVLVLVHYLGSDAFRHAVVAAARGAVGSEVGIGEMHVSLLTGATLRRVSVASPPGIPGDLLHADALVVRPRLWPLLWRRVEVREIRVEAPVIRLARGARGEWNYERLGSHPGPAAPPQAGGAPPVWPGPVPPAPGGAPLDVLIPRFLLTRGRLAVTGDAGRTLIQVEGLELASSLERLAGAVRVDGRLDVASLAVGERLVVRGLAAPLEVRDRGLRAAPLTASLADGTLGGEITVRLAAPGRYAARLELRDARVERLLADLGASRLLAGRLQARMQVEGTGGLSTLTGTGHAEIRQGQLLDLPVLGLLSTALHVPLLRQLRFEEGSIDLALADGILRTPAIRFVSKDLRVTGQGQIALRDGTLDHQLTLAVPEAVVARAPRETRAVFRPGPDGLMAVDFRVWGPYDAPRTDIQDRLLRGAAESILRKGLRELLR